MKRPTLANTKSMFRRANNLIKTRLIKDGRESLTRISDDLGKKEYPVFVGPVVRLIRHRSKHGIRQGSFPGPNVESTIETSLESPLSAEHPFRPNEDLAASKLVEEIFAQPVVSAGQTENLDETENPDDHPDLAGTGADPDDRSPETESETEATSDSPRTGSKSGPLVRTMVEAIPEGQVGEGGLVDFLAEDLLEIFTAPDYTNPRTKALLKSREHIDVHRLSEELAEFSKRIGAST